MKNKLVAIITITLGLVSSIVLFQNCNPEPIPMINGKNIAAQCMQNSNLKLAYTGGINNYSIPLGIAGSCSNQSVFNRMSFNANTQTVTLSDSSGANQSVSLALQVGGAGCSSMQTPSGDTFSGSIYSITLTLSSPSLQIGLTNNNTQSNDIACTQNAP